MGDTPIATRVLLLVCNVVMFRDFGLFIDDVFSLPPDAPIPFGVVDVDENGVTLEAVLRRIAIPY